MSTPWFFGRLGLEPTSDIKAIKRAYAVALKGIDQQHDREGFEKLRRAYELATVWARDEGLDDDSDDEVDDGLSDEWGEGSFGEPDNELDDRPSGTPGQHAGIHGTDEPHPKSPPSQDYATPPPETAAQQNARQEAEHLRQARADSHAALTHWLEKLLNPGSSRVDLLLAQALDDPRLMQLDSQSELERQIAEALHDAPAGRADLFDAAVTRFGWAERNARPQASERTAAWISRVINQTLQWEEQEIPIIAGRNNTLKVVTRTQRPSHAQAYAYWPLLRALHQQFPDWLALRLSPADLDRWSKAYEKIPARWLRLQAWRKRFVGSISRVVGTLMMISLVVGLAVPMIKAAINGPSPDKPSTSQSQASAPAAGKPAEIVLAYEFTGPVTQDSCESTHEFVHESNWLEIDDRDAIGLLATRVILCQDKQMWPQKDDPLAQCLRDARLQALSSATPETLGTCAASTAPTGK